MVATANFHSTHCYPGNFLTCFPAALLEFRCTERRIISAPSQIGASQALRPRTAALALQRDGAVDVPERVERGVGGAERQAGIAPGGAALDAQRGDASERGAHRVGTGGLARSQFLERESLLDLCRRTVTLKRLERARNEGSTGPEFIFAHRFGDPGSLPPHS